MKTSSLHDRIVATLAHVEERYDVGSAPEALIMMLTTADSAWSEISEDIQFDLSSWLAEQLSIDAAALLLIDIAKRGPEYVKQIVGFHPEMYDLSGNGHA